MWDAERVKIMRKWLAILSLIGLMSSIFFAQIFAPLSPGIVLDDASIFFRIPWAIMSYAFAILTVYFLLHLLTPMNLARLVALTTFLIGLHLFWRALAFMSYDSFSGRFTLGQVILGSPILMLGTAHLVCSVLLWRSPATGRRAMVPLGWTSAVIAVVLASIHCVPRAYYLWGQSKYSYNSLRRSEYLEAMWHVFFSMRDGGPQSDFWIIGLWIIFLGNSLCVIVAMRNPVVVQWCQSHGPRGFPVITEEGEDKGEES